LQRQGLRTRLFFLEERESTNKYDEIFQSPSSNSCVPKLEKEISEKAREKRDKKEKKGHVEVAGLRVL
jgi:hypothetical protein